MSGGKTGSVVLVGCGRLGSALVEGWLKSGAVAPHDLIILSPTPNAATDRAVAAGVGLNPPLEILGTAHALVLAVKPAKWREAAQDLVPALSATATVVSVMAGVGSVDLSSVFGQRALVRAMPTTGVATGQGVVSIWSGDAPGLAVAQSLFDPVAEVVLLAEEALIDVATAVSGSGQAYFYAFAESLARAGTEAGLDAASAAQLARATLISAGASAAADTLDLAALTARVASPGGTTEAGLKALMASGELDRSVEGAVQAALRRAHAIT